MRSDEIKKLMLDYAAEITRIRSRIRETFARRSESPQKWKDWKRACEDCHNGHPKLSWPVPYHGKNWLEAISSGEEPAVEYALCFLECRPYFFGSGYMYKDILRKCKRAPMSPEHAERFRVILEKWDAYRRSRRRD
jgi:hypothetical protein